MRRSRLGSSLVVAAMALAACSSDDGGSDETGAPSAGPETTVTVPPPEGLPAFYGVPDPVPDADPGTLLRSEVLDVAGVHGTVHRVLYVSRSLQGEPIAVSGLVAVPSGPAPDGGYPVMAWAHGTTGIADECAPSLAADESAPLANLLLDAGYAVAATDYEGLGTPGRHAYIAGESEARGVIDSVRAARQLADVDLADRYAVWGHSQGGHAAMFALHIAEAWAPELDLVGVVAGAPPSQLHLLYAALQASPFKHYLLMAAAGLNAAYGDEAAPLDAVLTPAGIEATARVDEGCAGDIQAATADLATAELTAADPATVPAWAEILRANDPGLFDEPSNAPLLVIHGGDDEQIPVVASALMFDQLCAIGQDQTRWVYPGQSHAGVIGPSTADMLTWIEHRFAGEDTLDVMVPEGQADVEVSQCETAAP